MSTIASPPSSDSAIALHKEETDLAHLLRSSLQPLIDQAAEEGIEIRVDDWKVAHVHVDREKVAWAVATLVGNALRYVRHGSRDELGGSVLIHLYEENPGELWVAVHDDGPGIPEDKLPYLFSRAPGAEHAVGLGLSLVHEVAEAHGGRVEVESRLHGPRQGTSIALVLPQPAANSDVQNDH